VELPWSERYLTGIDDLDEQHKILFTMLNDLAIAMKNGRAKYVILDTMSRLADYAQYHFDCEEKQMRRYDFPLYTEHKDAHDKFKVELAEMIKRSQEGDILVYLKTFKVLQGWIVKHVVDESYDYDQGFGQYVREYRDSII
jgi:hemerythrin